MMEFYTRKLPMQQPQPLEQQDIYSIPISSGRNIVDIPKGFAKGPLKLDIGLVLIGVGIIAGVGILVGIANSGGDPNKSEELGQDQSTFTRVKDKGVHGGRRVFIVDSNDPDRSTPRINENFDRDWDNYYR